MDALCDRDAPIPEDLIRHLIAGRCVAFVGAGFSAPVGMPSWVGLLNALVDRAIKTSVPGKDNTNQVVFCRDAIREGELQLAASAIKSLLQPPEILAEISEQFGDHRFRKLNLVMRRTMESRLYDLTLLPWHGIITTNYDNLIEFALQNFGQTRSEIVVDSGKQLGTLLCQPDKDRLYFAKIHGSTGYGRIVLSTEEYGETYFRDPKMERFLSAVMLTSTIVFLGCSLDDEVIVLRRRLTAEFEGHLPLAYALMPASGRNLRREEWLRSNARVQSLFYDDPTHGAFDRFLRAVRNQTEQLMSDPVASAETVKRLSTLPVATRWDELGEINRDLLRWVHRNAGSVRHVQVLERSGRKHAKRARSKLIESISGHERIYRILFLVSAGCLVERLEGRERFYILEPDVQDFLDRGS
jgi:hypothetical protein